jgi:L-alanine-DL-glutamate epimerase-like enolase superfamily enzyme
MRIAEMAHRYGVDLCPHSWHNGLMAMANGHLVAALPNPRVLELCLIQGPLQWGIFEGSPGGAPTVQDGYLHLPSRPGLGVELGPNVAAQYPYVEGHYAVIVER